MPDSHKRKDMFAGDTVQIWRRMKCVSSAKLDTAWVRGDIKVKIDRC